jgi:hypothetical protein
VRLFIVEEQRRTHMPRNHIGRTNASRTKSKYFVEINREEKGKSERKKFTVREDALAYAERKAARRIRVRVTDFDGKEIYSSQ